VNCAVHRGACNLIGTHHVNRSGHMNSENTLIDKVKEICGVASDNALAVTLGVQRQAISKIRRDEMHLSDERIAELCGMAKLDGGEWLARIHAERAASPAEKALWRSVLDRLSAAAAVVALGVFLFPGVVHANPIEINNLHASSADNLYIMLKSPCSCVGLPPSLLLLPLATLKSAPSRLAGGLIAG